ncbi:DUF1810 domain-containing protein [Candidatus Saccharibacteria bacterium]|nr:DUF1810 domain-containing protein [Candidatus Saccharibacteria bacterium]MBQ3465037.1 DUF1810 domain-containing protein [Candidatus Saccharibacteria bacterium]
MDSEYNLDRFITAQKRDYQVALMEIKNGHKRSHWMWYIFPQLADLGYSDTAKFYGIKNKDEAAAYLQNGYLKNNLVEISNTLYRVDDNIDNILDYPDDLKLKSCMTLFNYVNPTIEIFSKIIDKFYGGELDLNTIDILNKDVS